MGEQGRDEPRVKDFLKDGSGPEERKSWVKSKQSKPGP